MRYDAIILGAGISGLTAAHRLSRRNRRILLLESNDRVGGAIETMESDGFLIERGPNSLRGTHEFLDLVDELGIDDELIAADPRAPAYIYHRNALHAVPMGPAALIGTELLSLRGKMRLLAEPFISRAEGLGEESIASFIRRRLGDEVLERIVAPFVSGVYAGDAEQLSVQAAMARLAGFETDSGSIMLGALRGLLRRKPESEAARPARSLRRYRLCSFRTGLHRLPQALSASLGNAVMTGARVESVAQLSIPEGEPVFEIEAVRGRDRQVLTTGTLIVATPAYTASELTLKLSPGLSALLAEISYNSLVTAPLAWRATQIGRPLDGFGFLAPRNEGLRTLGSIWNSTLFPDRSRQGWALLTNFIGGSTDPGAVNLEDGELRRIASDDLKRVLGIEGEPLALPLTRYWRAIPQYTIGHAERIEKIRKAVEKVNGLVLIGNYMDGVSLGDCIKHARDAADHCIDPNRSTIGAKRETAREITEQTK
ncbi:MAG: protoporphyrinogen oxidase [Acidobacteria bacterium]|nr:protoporphyrinogen oxidase [Acidobacteriota bacterium]